MDLNFNVIMEEKVIKLVVDYVKTTGIIINKDNAFIV